LRHTRLTVSFPTAPSNSAANARLTRRADEFDDGDTIRQRPAAPVPRFAYCSGRP
jgi:hypothetical protein